jgi:hypothetical protein
MFKSGRISFSRFTTQLVCVSARRLWRVPTTNSRMVNPPFLHLNGNVFFNPFPHFFHFFLHAFRLGATQPDPVIIDQRSQEIKACVHVMYPALDHRVHLLHQIEKQFVFLAVMRFQLTPDFPHQHGADAAGGNGNSQLSAFQHGRNRKLHSGS